MIDNATPAERAEGYATAARLIYEREGGVAPMVALICETKVVMAMAYGETHDQPAQFGAILAVLAGRFQPHTVVTVTEAWHKVMPANTDVTQIRRGQLAAEQAAGTPGIATALLTIAWRLDDDETHSIIDTVVSQRPCSHGKGWQGIKGRKPVTPKVRYERTASTGPQDGHMADVVMTYWQAAIQAPPPDEATDEALFELLTHAQLAAAVSVQAWDD